VLDHVIGVTIPTDVTYKYKGKKFVITYKTKIVNYSGVNTLQLKAASASECKMWIGALKATLTNAKIEELMERGDSNTIDEGAATDDEVRARA
jgi:hypothetical protein